MGRGRKGHSGETNRTAGWCRGPHCSTFMCKTHPRIKHLTCPLPHDTRKGESSKVRSGQSGEINQPQSS